MKLFKIGLIVIVALTFFGSCQKELNLPTHLSSIGTLKDSAGYCLPMKMHGVCSTLVDLNYDNYIDVHVNLDTTGPFALTTDTVNNYWFSGNGTFGYTGDNLVRLYGHGFPLTGGPDGINQFTVHFGKSSCKLTVVVAGPVTPPASYSLDTSSGNICTGAVLSGVYRMNQALTRDNKVTLKVNVAQKGLYTFSTDSQDGIIFAGSYVFREPGEQNVTLYASGTPQAPGSLNFTATTTSQTATSCQFSVIVADTVAGTPPPPPPPPSTAVFTLGGDPGSCSGFLSAGTYTAGTALNGTNTVSCQVNVTTVGTYSIATNSVNGISFSKTGTFTATGLQTVVLNGSGTPSVAGANNYTATAGSSSCTFSITSIAVTPPPGNNYFPLAQGNVWTHDLSSTPGDTAKLSINGTGVFAGNTYNRLITEYPSYGFTNDTNYVRKVGSDYHMWEPSDGGVSSGAFTFDNPSYVDILLLKENGTIGTTWSTATYTGTTSGGTVNASLKYVFTISNTGISYTANGITYNNVLVETEDVMVDYGAGFSTVETETIYYANNIGIIQERSTDPLTPVLNLRYFSVH